MKVLDSKKKIQLLNFNTKQERTRKDLKSTCQPTKKNESCFAAYRSEKSQENLQLGKEYARVIKIIIK